jgi:large subunit ribosomal protein L5
MSMIQDKYNDEVKASLMKEFGYDSIMQVPKLDKIVINMGLGGAVTNNKLVEEAAEELKMISGQKPMVCNSKKSIAGFKLREEMPIGLKVTLRGDQMWNFIDKLVAIALPRVRDFRGINAKAFDGRGNYTLGVTEHIIFSEIDYDKVNKIKGMDISFVTTAMTNEEGLALLSGLGMPFQKKGE